ncbi:gamma-interferon-inducible lysosomal thiol reductase-like [Penaeus chinensis]|uniref:gamma-interferon-inducible lysosomal thiol reductase-like n=1 Tax=Penaeus chinensis TaxID=139456 RepID=UPI001FB78BFE|nr:gamma-interferon-inducible lysosomal thiol reductase-like [Penaeus chinensis]
MAVNITAYGFASDQPSGDGYVFECQHGPGECKGNMIVVCAKKYLDHETYVDFTLCLMSGFYPPIEGEKCAERVEVEWQPIDNCSQSVEGEQLLHEAGLEQGLLDPRPDWMPWIIFNDIYSASAVNYQLPRIIYLFIFVSLTLQVFEELLGAWCTKLSNL